jgi:site-specific recombinase XerC
VLDELTRHAISAWLAELAETAEPSTVGTRLRGMRRFCRWLETEGELETAPTDGIEIVTSPDKPVPILFRRRDRRHAQDLRGAPWPARRLRPHRLSRPPG